MQSLQKVDVIIRAVGYSPSLSATVTSLLSQQGIQLHFIIVNSSSSEEGLLQLANNIITVPYVTSRYNYSEAINKAIPFLKNEFTLIISSHTSICNPFALLYGVSLMKSHQQAAAANFSDQCEGSLSFTSVDLQSFNGWNGAWNTATMYRTKLLRDRPFRPEVVSAEDQEWSRWVLEKRDMQIYHIVGSHTINANPRRLSIAKRLKEWEFISAYAYPSYLSYCFIVAKLRTSVGLLFNCKVSSALFELMIALVLIRVRLFGVYSSDSSY